MNILDVIKDCIENPCFTKEYGVEEHTINDTEIKSESVSSNFTSFKKSNHLYSQTHEADEKLCRLYMRIWLNLCKLIRKTVSDSKCLVIAYIGCFYPLEEHIDKYMFTPITNLLTKFSIYNDQYNKVECKVII